MNERRKSVLLTERDFLLLRGLYDYSLMSYPQIERMYFEGKSKSTIINRLSKLESSEFISKYRVPRLMAAGSHQVISVVYQITKKGIRELQKRYLEEELYPDPIRLQAMSIDHDLLLVDVLCAFQKRHKEMSFELGAHFCLKQNSSGIKPDAILRLSKSEKPTALELELTAKSEKRYRELILKYRLSKEFSSVLYVTGSGVISRKIQSILGPPQMKTNFRFLTMEEVLKWRDGEHNNQIQRNSLEESEVNR